MKNINDLFLTLTKYILEYEAGDVILLSDLLDVLIELKNEVKDNKPALKIIELLVNITNNNLSGEENSNFVDNITNGVDLLQKILDEKDDGNKKSINEKVENFINLYKNNNSKKDDKPDSVREKIDPSKIISDDLIRNFIIEAEERIAKAQELILELENDNENQEIINNLFRVFHTIKGECGFLKIASFGELTHNVENLLDLLRNKKITVDPAIIDILLEGVDLSKEIIAELKKGEVVLYNSISLETYINNLNLIKEKTKPNLGEVLVKNGKLTELDIMKIMEKQKESAFSKKFGEIAVENNFISEKELTDSLANQKIIENSDHTGKEGDTKKIDNTDQIIKVKAVKVNYIVDMIGELLISIGQINDNSQAFIQMRKITKILQYAAMQLRTDDVKNLFGNIKRVIRDVSKKLNKNVNTEIFGEDLEIDRNLIEKIEEPLMHLVRNSIYHGIESEEERIRKDKNQVGTITIGTERKGNNIIISIMDDGEGLNKEKILMKALEKKLIKESEVSTMTENQIFNQIFVNGFSTAETIDYVSGRGVGMDIVKSIVTANKGKIEIQTEKDKFTKFKLIFPLSTAIIDGMIVKIEGNYYIIPIASIIQSLKIKKELVNKVNNNIEVIKIREEIFPIINLKEVFGIEQKDGTNFIGVIVETSSGKKFVLLVDEIIAKREVVIKSLGKKFRNLKGISSGTVLSGGKIGLVLDIDQIVELSQNMGVK